jgi:hypothetical protein
MRSDHDLTTDTHLFSGSWTIDSTHAPEVIRVVRPFDEFTGHFKGRFISF